MYILENKKRGLYIKKVQNTSSDGTFTKVGDRALAYHFKDQKEIGACLKNPIYKKLAKKFGKFEVSVVPKEEEIDNLIKTNNNQSKSNENISNIFEHKILFEKSKDKKFFDRGKTFLEETEDVYKSLVFAANVILSLEDCCANMEHKQREIDLIIEDMLHELRKTTTKLDACKMSKFTKVLQVQSQKRIEVKLNKIMCQTFLDVLKNNHQDFKNKNLIENLESIHSTEYKNRRVVLDDVWEMFDSIKKCNM